VCRKDFEARRDTALLMVLLDAGPRRAELLGMRLEDLDFEYDVVHVVGKGGRERAWPFGRKTALALIATCASGRVIGSLPGCAQRRRDRGGPDAHRGLAVPGDACPLPRLGRRCACRDAYRRLSPNDRL
jgi:integrase